MSRFNDDWDQFVRALDSYDIELKRKKDLKDSITVLRKSLGDNWLKSVGKTNHPLLWRLRTVSGAVSDLILLLWAQSISSLEKVVGFEKLIKRIKDDKCFESAITELELASRLAEHGCSIMIEPTIGKKQPDLLCKYGNYEFFIEVKTSSTAKETEKANKTSHEIISTCSPLFPAGIIFKPLSTPHLDEIKSILQERTAFVLKNKTAVEVDIPNVLKLYLVSDDDPDRIQKYRNWYKKQESSGINMGYGGLVGPPDGVRQEYRVKIRLDRLAKEKQIPTEKSGLVVLVSDFNFWKIDDVVEFVDAILESVYELTNIPAVILWSRKVIVDGKSHVTERDDFIFIENYLFGEIKEDIIIVKNRFCKTKFDYETLKELLVVSE